MSIRPANLEEEFPETSFEDLDTTLNKLTSHSNEVPEITSKDANNYENVVGSTAITESVTGSSENTTFSSVNGRYKQDKTYEESLQESEQDDDFFDDFAEFRTKKDGFDEALRMQFRLPHNSEIQTYNDNDDMMIKELEKQKDAGIYDEIDYEYETDQLAKSVNDKLLVSQRLRQPRSMMEIKGRNQSSTRHRFGTSRSSGNLRQKSIIGSNNVRFKQSLPSLSRYTLSQHDDISEESENEEFNNPNQNFRNDPSLIFSSFQDQDDDENGFDLNEQFENDIFSNRRTKNVGSLKLSLSQYDIIQDDTLLTPRLQKRHKEWNSRTQLNSFKESKRNTHSVLSKIKTIKQEIDHNTPIKNGQMYYSPKTMRWEGNEKVLEKFENLNSVNRKPLLIKSKSLLRPSSKSTVNSVKKENLSEEESVDTNHPLLESKSPRIVGKMMFDEENLRWVNMEKTDDIFKNVPDVSVPQKYKNGLLRFKNNPSPFLRSKSHQLFKTASSKSERYNSSASTRFHSLGQSIPSRQGLNDNTFQISTKKLERFYHEENKWIKNIGSWISINDKNSIIQSQSNESDVTKNANNEATSYMYEIRSMVMNSSRG